MKNSILCHYSCEVKIFENKPETWQGAGVRQLVIAGLDNGLRDRCKR
jgi:hypothetical protein